MKGWVGLVGWPVADGLPTLVVTHQLQVERRTGKVRQSETDVPPRSHATNLTAWWQRLKSGMARSWTLNPHRSMHTRRLRKITHKGIKRHPLCSMSAATAVTDAAAAGSIVSVVRLSVPSIESSNGGWQVCCWAPCGRKYRAVGAPCTRRRRSAANADSVLLTAEGGG